jgi:hypothetical protein
VGSNLFVVNDVEIGKNFDVFGMSTFNNDVFFQDDIVVQGKTTLSGIVETNGITTIKGPLEIAGSNLLVSGSSLSSFVQSIVGTSISSAGNASFSNLQVADGVTFLNSNNIIIGGCNLLFYLNKIETLSNTLGGGGGGDSNNSNVSSTNINASNVTSSNVNTFTINASNAIFSHVNSTNLNTFALTSSNINASGILSSNITTFSINTSNINIASSIHTSNINAHSISSSNITTQEHISQNITSSTIEVSSNLVAIGGIFSNLSTSNAVFNSLVSSNATFDYTTISNLQVIGNSDFTGSSNIFWGDVVINSNLTVLGTQTFSNLGVLGNASFCNMVYAEESNVMVSDCNLSLYLSKVRELADIINFDDSNIAALSNNIIANANTVLMDDVYIESNLYIGGHVIVHGLTCMNNVKLTNITQYTGIDCTGAALFRTDATFCNDIFIVGATSMAGNLLVSGQSFLNRAIIQKNMQVGCNLTVGSNLIVAGNLNVTGGLNLSSNVIINGSLNVIKNTNLDSNLIVLGTSTFASNVNVNTLLSASNIVATSNLGVIGTANFNGEVSLSNKLRFPKGSNDWFIFAESNSMNLYQTDLVFQSQGNTRVVFSEDFQTATFNFTGSHRCTWCNCDNDIELDNELKYDHEMIGKIVVSMGKYDNLDNSPFIEIDEAVPIVCLAKSSYQNTVFGVIAGFEERNSDNRFFKIGNMCFTRKKKQENRKVIVNAVGEGGIWVCNINGSLKNGDLITTSDIEGLGMKQYDDIVRSYTVAKITCDCDFSLESKVYKCREFMNKGYIYRQAFVGCIYKF